MGYSHLLLAVLLCCTANTHSVYGTVIHIPSQDTLDQSSTNSLAYYLCEGAGNLTSNTTIVLSHTIVHYIPPGSFCLVENIAGLTIYGNSSDNPAVVKCNSTSHHVRGFGFFNVTNLSISNIVVERCGGVIDQNAIKYINISFFYFQPGQRAVFLFNHCFDLMLDRTEIREYKGFAVIGANVMGSSSVTKTVLTSSTLDEYHCTSVGAFIFYVESELLHRPMFHNADTTLTISECNFFNNALVCIGGPIVYTYLISLFSNVSAMALGGVNIAFSQQSYFVHIHVQQSNFSVHDSDQEGVAGSGLLLLYVFRDLMSKVTIDECMFDGQPLEVEFYFRTDSVNLKNMIGYGSNATVCATEIKNSTILRSVIYVDQHHFPGDYTQFTKVSLNNVRLMGCSFVSAKSIYGNLILEMNNIRCLCPSLTAISITSLAKFSISSSLEAQSLFESTLIDVTDTDVYVSGNLSFMNSTLHLDGSSHLVLQEPLSAMFAGKAYNEKYCLAVTTTQFYMNTSPSTPEAICPIQFSSLHIYTPDNLTDIDIHLTFINVSATAYDYAIYTATIDYCQLYGTINATPREIYNATIHVANDPNTFLHISAQPTDINISCKCNSMDQESNCSTSITYNISTVSITTYPGKAFHIGIAVIDENSNPVYGIVKAQLGNVDDYLTLEQQQGTFQFSGETNCSMYNFSIKNPQPTRSVSYSQMSFVVVSIPNFAGDSLIADASNYLSVYMLDCPAGFTNTEGKCDCIPLLANYGAICNIDTGSIKIPMYTDAWIGVVNNLTVGVSKNCPASYCNLGEVDFSRLGSICDGNRTGVVCGQCDNDLSVQFGSTKCSRCSSMWLLSIAVYALAGVLLVILLFVLRLTVDKGTVNGLIFYANILGINARYFLQDSKLQFLLIFISLVNLELGFPVCFYNGMNDIVKTGLQFVFPIYIWSIVIFIIFASRYSTRVSRLTSRSSVQVLATLIHLSYSKLLSTTVDILVYETIETESHNGSINTYTAWYFDGSVQYLTEGHIVLFILALMTLTLFIIPYTIVLTGASFFVRYKAINYFKPVFDAYYGPYKDKWHFWFGSRLWVLAAMLIIYTTLENSEELMLLLQLVLLLLFILVQASIKPFKNALIGWLDLFFMLNYSAVALVTLYSHSQRSEAIVMTIGVLVATALVAFIGIILYHINLACNLQRFCRQDPRVNMQGVGEYEPLEGSGYDHVYNAGYEDARFREPLLGSQS